MWKTLSIKRKNEWSAKEAYDGVLKSHDLHVTQAPGERKERGKMASDETISATYSLPSWKKS